MRLAREANVQVVTKVGRTLFDPEELIKVNGGKPTMSITQVEHVSNFYKCFAKCNWQEKYNLFTDS